MEQRKLILFDMDGTLLNTLTDLYNSVNHCMREWNLPEITMEQCRNYVGNGLKCLISRASGCTDDKQLDKMMEKYLPYYCAHNLDTTAPYEGVADVLRVLKEKGYITACITNKNHLAAQDLSEKFFPGLLDITIGEDPSRKRKPAPDGLFAVMEQYHLTQQDAVYIGDSEVDVATAKNAGVPCISVLWGFRTKEELLKAGATIFAKDTEELRDILLA